MEINVVIATSIDTKDKFFAFCDSQEYELRVENQVLKYDRIIPKEVLTTIQFELNVFESQLVKKT